MGGGPSDRFPSERVSMPSLVEGGAGCSPVCQPVHVSWLPGHDLVLDDVVAWTTVDRVPVEALVGDEQADQFRVADGLLRLPDDPVVAEGFGLRAELAEAARVVRR